MVLSFSQLKQDVEVLEIYNNLKNGFFIEIGANDGIKYSNTYLLEKYYNWKGICIEPIPSLFNTLCKNRPNSICCKNAVYNQSNLNMLFNISNTNTLLSGMHNHYDNANIKNIVDSDKEQILVKTITLNDLLIKYNSPKFIHYLSLDTEGTELEILQSVDFSKYTFGLIDIEHNFIEPKRSQIRELLVLNGYNYRRQNKFDDCYIHKSILYEKNESKFKKYIAISLIIIIILICYYLLIKKKFFKNFLIFKNNNFFNKKGYLNLK